MTSPFRSLRRAKETLGSGTRRTRSAERDGRHDCPSGKAAAIEDNVRPPVPGHLTGRARVPDRSEKGRRGHHPTRACATCDPFRYPTQNGTRRSRAADVLGDCGPYAMREGAASVEMAFTQHESRRCPAPPVTRLLLYADEHRKRQWRRRGPVGDGAAVREHRQLAATCRLRRVAPATDQDVREPDTRT